MSIQPLNYIRTQTFIPKPNFKSYPPETHSSHIPSKRLTWLVTPPVLPGPVGGHLRRSFRFPLFHLPLPSAVLLIHMWCHGAAVMQSPLQTNARLTLACFPVNCCERQWCDLNVPDLDLRRRLIGALFTLGTLHNTAIPAEERKMCVPALIFMEMWKRHVRIKRSSSTFQAPSDVAVAGERYMTQRSPCECGKCQLSTYKRN